MRAKFDSIIKEVHKEVNKKIFKKTIDFYVILRYNIYIKKRKLRLRL